MKKEFHWSAPKEGRQKAEHERPSKSGREKGGSIRVAHAFCTVKKTQRRGGNNAIEKKLMKGTGGGGPGRQRVSCKAALKGGHKSVWHPVGGGAHGSNGINIRRKKPDSIKKRHGNESIKLLEVPWGGRAERYSMKG